MTSARRPKAVDLYAGIGGWAVGLRMAGVQLAGSYEWWEEAARTHEANHGEAVTTEDIRLLPLECFPRKVDLVVGSPPCTQFSFSNRGGKGDIQDGLVDIRKFLEVVEELKPRAWAMENVPRVAAILEELLRPGREFDRFAHLFGEIEVVDAAEWGVPQRRRRMIAGNFDFDLLRSYRDRQPTRTLGEIVSALKIGRVDPVFGWDIDTPTDHVEEARLTAEEMRLNRDQKEFHRVYNKMPFPDQFERPARTVTALCTRVSRESIVIRAGQGVRRLTIRERASLQSFPAHFQLHGRTVHSKMKMVGNAVPPLLAFHIVHAMLGTPANSPKLKPSKISLGEPTGSTKPNSPRRRHNPRRSFAAAIPSLRFGSGMRFEFVNEFLAGGQACWRTRFFFGSSKEVKEVLLGRETLDWLSEGMVRSVAEKGRVEVVRLLKDFGFDHGTLQEAWSSSDFEHGPFALVDRLGEVAQLVLAWIPELSSSELAEVLAAPLGVTPSEMVLTRLGKVLKHGDAVLAGLIVCSAFNAGSEPANLFSV